MKQNNNNNKQKHTKSNGGRVGRRAVHTHHYKSGFQARYGEVAVNFLTLKRKSGGRARPYQ